MCIISCYTEARLKIQARVHEHTQAVLSATWRAAQIPLSERVPNLEVHNRISGKILTESIIIILMVIKYESTHVPLCQAALA